MSKMINDEISDAVFLKYKENIAETETLIMAVRTSRERAERLSRSTRCSRVEKRYINKRRAAHRKGKMVGLKQCTKA